ncbi:MAG TPA: prolipoprotein diacylglyceryl transferase [Chloroflexia bacterium]|nr:prolipoprotein diacylglyceryl transferase [Chloroflexia bacterium]
MSNLQHLLRFNVYKSVLTLPGILIAYSLMVSLFFLLRLQGSPDPMLFHFAGLSLRWFGVLIALGVVLAFYITRFLAEKGGEDAELVWALLPVVLISGISGARIWYILNTWEKYKDHLFSFGDPNFPGAFEIWRGGIAVQGAIAGGILGGLIYMRLKRMKFLRWADFVMPGVVAAQALGRWADFTNNEAYGSQTSLPWGIQIPCQYRTQGLTPGSVDTSCPGVSPTATFHPTFLYESIWDYTVFLILFNLMIYPERVERTFKVKLQDGDVFFGYLVLYSLGRFMIEFLRTDSLYLIGNPLSGGIRSAQAVALVSFLIGTGCLLYRHRSRFPVKSGDLRAGLRSKK